MDDQAGNPNRSGRTISNHVYLDTTKAYKAGCLMKCPPLVSRTLRSRPSDAADASRPVAKVVVSLDPLNCNNDSSPQYQLITKVALMATLQQEVYPSFPCPRFQSHPKI